ncbi:hypothetical protein [Wenjunlia tyrosinilytica]|uniref:Fido domain-containing protein n=1 Tax=Wenjunlia tyrosinilytica TaxID=1544741 RepID=A0A917ZUJ2_9ACTN|nr:hypothetical protein [Wenjunlia tyrosinilytica]GGO94369.1 hypothetical protein GCM10012280_49030 [Wenjunlia tyrosinilytica]
MTTPSDITVSQAARLHAPSSSSVGGEPAHLSTYLPQDQWWKLYIDPIHHEAAQERFPENPGGYYDNDPVDPSPGYQQSMQEAYQKFLDSPEAMSARMDAKAYEEMHWKAAEHLTDAAATQWSGNGVTEFPLRGDQASSSPKEELLSDRELLLDVQEYFSAGVSHSRMPDPITILDRSNPQAQAILKTNYQADQVQGLVEKSFERYYDEAAQSKNDEEKLQAIGKQIRTLQIVHPFTDYNRRVNNHILLPKMLMENGFPPVMPDASNKLFQGGFSKQQIAESLLTTIQRDYPGFTQSANTTELGRSGSNEQRQSSSPSLPPSILKPSSSTTSAPAR